MSAKSKPGGFVTFLLVVLGLYISYYLVIFLAKATVFSGYNFFFFTDNLVSIKGFNPIANWAILGLLFGSIAGVIIARKKFQLPRLLILYPVLATAVFVSIMWFANGPTRYAGNLSLPSREEPVAAAEPTYKVFYKTNAAITARSGPSITDRKVFSLKKRIEVELIKRRVFDQDNTEWFSVKYKDQEGFIKSKFLTFSRTVNVPVTDDDVNSTGWTNQTAELIVNQWQVTEITGIKKEDFARRSDEKKPVLEFKDNGKCFLYEDGKTTGSLFYTVASNGKSLVFKDPATNQTKHLDILSISKTKLIIKSEMFGNDTAVLKAKRF